MCFASSSEAQAKDRQRAAGGDKRSEGRPVTLNSGQAVRGPTAAEQAALGAKRSRIGVQPLMIECLRVATINQRIDNAPDVVEAALAEFLRLCDPAS